jgi:hypothetical protein
LTIGFKLNARTHQDAEGRAYGALGPSTGDVYIVNGIEVTREQMQREYSKVFEQDTERMFQRGLMNL